MGTAFNLFTPGMLAESLMALIGPEAVAIQRNAEETDQTMTAANADGDLGTSHRI
jgi:hypothetical protein